MLRGQLSGRCKIHWWEGMGMEVRISWRINSCARWTNLLGIPCLEMLRTDLRKELGSSWCRQIGKANLVLFMALPGHLMGDGGRWARILEPGTFTLKSGAGGAPWAPH